MSARKSRRDPHLALGVAVRVRRARLGMSQEGLGHNAGLHRNYVGAIERGEINPTFATLMRLSRGLALPLSELIREYEAEVADTANPDGRPRSEPASNDAA